MSADDTPQQKPPPQDAGKPPADSGKPPVGGATIPVEHRQWAMFAHLFGLIAGATTMLGFLGPLIVWLIKKNESPFIDDQGKEALNFQLTMLGLFLITGALAAFTCVLFFLPVVPWCLTVVFGIIACIQSNQGIPYRYPICIRVVN